MEVRINKTGQNRVPMTVNHICVVLLKLPEVLTV
jgi:hypothetical protein